MKRSLAAVSCSVSHEGARASGPATLVGGWGGGTLNRGGGGGRGGAAAAAAARHGGLGPEVVALFGGGEYGEEGGAGLDQGGGGDQGPVGEVLVGKAWRGKEGRVAGEEKGGDLCPAVDAFVVGEEALLGELRLPRASLVLYSCSGRAKSIIQLGPLQECRLSLK